MNTQTVPTIFLDTNALHNSASYLIQARKHSLPPFGVQSDITAIRAHLKQTARLPSGLVNGLVGGLQLISYLQYQTQNHDAQVYTSWLALAEMWHGRLEGQAHIRMATEGIPFRQRQKPSDMSTLVMSRLTQEDYDLVKNELDGLLDSLQDELGIRIQLVEQVRSPSIQDITHLALSIQQQTFLDVPDCYLYAGSLAVLANEFLTSDQYLRTVINSLQNPNSQQDSAERILWQTVQARIIEDLRNLHLSPISQSDLVLAHAPTSSWDRHIAELHLL